MDTTVTAHSAPAAAAELSSCAPNGEDFQEALDSESCAQQKTTASDRPPVQIPASSAYSTAKTESADEPPGSTPEDSPASDGTSGKTEYTVRGGDTLASIAQARGQTVDDILLANPGLTASSSLQDGQKIKILNEARLAFWRDISTTSDPETLASLIRQEMQYASSNSATPEDLIEAIKSDLLKLRPCDCEFKAMVDEQAAWSHQLWTAQGRTHEVIDPLKALATSGDTDGLKAALLDIFRTVAATTPTTAAVEGQRDVLLRYGPQSELFQTAVAEAADMFLVQAPAQAAQAIADAFEQGGPLAAAALLRTYTKPGNVDPLTAALILNASAETIQAIIPFLNAEALIGADGTPPQLDAVTQLTIFSHLNAAVDNASRSQLAASAITDIAKRINAQNYMLVQFSVEHGDGVVLALEMIKQSDNAEVKTVLAASVLEGINEFKAQLRQSVSAFADNSLAVTDPALLWGSLLEKPEQAFEAVLDSTGTDGRTVKKGLEDDIARIDVQGYQLMRIIVGVADYASELVDHGALLAAGAMPTPGSNRAIELALGSTPALLEALRAANTHGLQDGGTLDPYAAILDPTWFQPQTSAAGWNAFHRWQSDVSAAIPLGVGLSLSGLGTTVLGVANPTPGVNSGSGWGADTADLLYRAEVTLEATKTIAALLAMQLDLGGMTPDEIADLPLLQGTSNGSVYNQILHATFLNHLKTFGVFNIIASMRGICSGAWTSPSDTGSDNRDDRFKRSFATVLASYTAATPIAWGSRVVGYSTSFSTRLDFHRAVMGWSATILPVMNDVFEPARWDRDRFYFEKTARLYLEASGMRPEIASLLAGKDAAPALRALSTHLNLGRGELLNWLNQQSVDSVETLINRDAANPDRLIGIIPSAHHPAPDHRAAV